MTEISFEFMTQRLQQFSQLWEEFIHRFDEGLEADPPTDDDEHKFLQLQLEIVRRAQYLMVRMPGGIFDIYGDIMKLFRDSISLKLLKTEPAIRITAMRTIWHECQISLNKMGGQLRTRMQESQEVTSKGLLARLMGK